MMIPWRRRDVDKYIHKLRTYPLDLIISKALTKVRIKSYRVRDRAKAVTRGTRISDSELLQALRGFEDIESLEEHLLTRSYYLEDMDFEHAIADSDLIIQIADSILQGRMEILGRVTQFPEGRIDWHSDFTCGFKWNGETYFADIVYGDVLGADIKVPRELSRLQFLTPLAGAYLITGNAKYIDNLCTIVFDWLEKNPPKFGPAWDCTMDVAIRAANLCIIYSLLRKCGCRDRKLYLEIVRSLYSHACFIVNELEYADDFTNNHYISDIVGLIYIGSCFPEFTQSDEWLAYGIQELISEMDRQVNKDGSNHEASTCYHRLVTELFLSATILVFSLDTNRRKRLAEFNHQNLKPIVGPKLRPLAKQEFDMRNPSIFFSWYLKRLEKMLEFTLYITKPNGKAPQIGDNDSGRLFKFTPIGVWNEEGHFFEEDMLDHRHLLAIGGEFFNRNDFREVGLPFIQEAYWYGFNPGPKRPKDSESQSRSLTRLRTLESKAFPDFGLYIMRNDNNYMAIRCGDIGQNKTGGHAHNDQLSFELNVGGEDIIVDPGTYVYTSYPEWRNHFRSNSSHNTVIIDGREQSRYFDWTLFALNDDARATCLKWETGEDSDLFEGEHYGYSRLSKPVVHGRRVAFQHKKNIWEIGDTFEGTDDYRLKWRFVFAPGVKVSKKNAYSVLLMTNSLAIEMQFNTGVVLDINQDSWYSPRYGIKVPSEAITISIGTLPHLSPRYMLIIKK